MVHEEIAITGLGAVSSLGIGCAALWSGIAEGRSGIRAVERFSTRGFSTSLAGTVTPWDEQLPPDHERRFRDLCARFAIAAAREAMDAADLRGVPPERIAFVVGTSTGGTTEGLHLQAQRMARALGIAGPHIAIGTACCSSTNAIGLARELLDLGSADAVVAGGADALAPELFAGFAALGALSPGPCAPFSVPAGTLLAEGAGFLVLERAPRARARRGGPFPLLLGYGLANDAYHPTAPDPSGGGVARGLRGALADAALEPGEVGYVNLHGTGTAANDPAEAKALCAVFGDRAATLPVSSTKGHLGHAQGATGALEIITTLLALSRQVVPPTLNFTRPRPGCPADPVAQDTPRPHAYRYALSTNSAFSGSNAAVAVGLGAPRARRALSREVYVLGVGAVGPHGHTLSSLSEALAGARKLSARVPAFHLEELVPDADEKGLDPSGRYLVAAAGLALADARTVVSGPLRERAGLVVASNRRSPESDAEFRRSIEERGLERLSTSAFARRVLSAPAGACARTFSLKGPTCTLACGRGGGLVALAYASHLVASRVEAELVLAGGLDELPAGPDAEGASEGAACLVLSSQPPSDRAAPKLAGVGIAGPGLAAEAISQACAQAGISAGEVEVVVHDGTTLPSSLHRTRQLDVSKVLGRAESAGSAFAAAAALLAVRSGARVALVVSGEGGTATSAAVLGAVS